MIGIVLTLTAHYNYKYFIVKLLHAFRWIYIFLQSSKLQNNYKYFYVNTIKETQYMIYGKYKR